MRIQKSLVKADQSSNLFVPTDWNAFAKVSLENQDLNYL